MGPVTHSVSSVKHCSMSVFRKVKSLQAKQCHTLPGVCVHTSSADRGVSQHPVFNPLCTAVLVAIASEHKVQHGKLIHISTRNATQHLLNHARCLMDLDTVKMAE